MLRRERGGGQSQTQGPQGAAFAAPHLKPLLKLQLRAGHDTKRAEATANATKQHFANTPVRREDITSTSSLLRF